MNSLNKAKQSYRNQIRDAVKRGISFELTFNEWYDWWLSHGIDKNIHVNHNLCMCRPKDQGSYKLDNIYLGTRSENAKEAWTHRDHSFKLKKISTPVGIFNSRKEAAEYYKVDPTNINYWIKTKESFYYID